MKKTASLMLALTLGLTSCSNLLTDLRGHAPHLPALETADTDLVLAASDGDDSSDDAKGDGDSDSVKNSPDSNSAAMQDIPVPASAEEPGEISEESNETAKPDEFSPAEENAPNAPAAFAMDTETESTKPWNPWDPDPATVKTVASTGEITQAWADNLENGNTIRIETSGAASLNQMLKELMWAGTESGSESGSSPKINFDSDITELTLDLTGCLDIETIKYTGSSSSKPFVRLVLPLDVKNLGEFTFSCKNLKEVYIPKSVEKIDAVAFYQCFELQDIRYEGTVADWESIARAEGCLAADAILHCSDGSSYPLDRNGSIVE